MKTVYIDKSPIPRTFLPPLFRVTTYDPSQASESFVDYIRYRALINASSGDDCQYVLIAGEMPTHDFRRVARFNFERLERVHELGPSF